MSDAVVSVSPSEVGQTHPGVPTLTLLFGEQPWQENSTAQWNGSGSLGLGASSFSPALLPGTFVATTHRLHFMSNEPGRVYDLPLGELLKIDLETERSTVVHVTSKNYAQASFTFSAFQEADRVVKLVKHYAFQGPENQPKTAKSFAFEHAEERKTPDFGFFELFSLFP